MNKLRKNESGFSAVEVILALIIVALICVVGYMVYKNHHKTNTAVATKKSSSQTSTTSKPTNPYAGWLTCNDTTLGVHFRYPASWSESGRADDCGALAGPDREQAFTLTSPSANGSERFVLSYNQCLTPNPQSSSSTDVLAVTPLNTAVAPVLYATLFQFHSPNPQTESPALTLTSTELSVTSQKYALGQQPVSYYEYCTATNNKANADYTMGAYLTNSDSQNSNPNTNYGVSDYQSNPYYKDIIKIFQSISYN